MKGRVNLKIVGDFGYKGEMEFKTYIMMSGEYGIICPLCKCLLKEKWCNNRHFLYVIVDEQADKKIYNDIFLNEEEDD